MRAAEHRSALLRRRRVAVVEHLTQVAVRLKPHAGEAVAEATWKGGLRSRWTFVALALRSRTACLGLKRRAGLPADARLLARTNGFRPTQRRSTRCRRHPGFVPGGTGPGSVSNASEIYFNPSRSRS